MYRTIEINLFGCNFNIELDDVNTSYDMCCDAIIKYAPEEVKVKLSKLTKAKLLDILTDTCIDIRNQIQGQQALDEDDAKQIKDEDWH